MAANPHRASRSSILDIIELILAEIREIIEGRFDVLSIDQIRTG
jgi:hypothetical protein